MEQRLTGCCLQLRTKLGLFDFDRTLNAVVSFMNVICNPS